MNFDAMLEVLVECRRKFKSLSCTLTLLFLLPERCRLQEWVWSPHGGRLCGTGLLSYFLSSAYDYPLRPVTDMNCAVSLPRPRAILPRPATAGPHVGAVSAGHEFLWCRSRGRGGKRCAAMFRVD